MSDILFECKVEKEDYLKIETQFRDGKKLFLFDTNCNVYLSKEDIIEIIDFLRDELN